VHQKYVSKKPNHISDPGFDTNFLVFAPMMGLLGYGSKKRFVTRSSFVVADHRHIEAKISSAGVPPDVG
jgi:hypothetical protein